MHVLHSALQPACPPLCVRTIGRAVRSQAVRWARNSRHLVAMVRQCSAEAELARGQPQAQVRTPHLYAHPVTSSSTHMYEDCTGCQTKTPRLLHQHRNMKQSFVMLTLAGVLWRIECRSVRQSGALVDTASACRQA